MDDIFLAFLLEPSLNQKAKSNFSTWSDRNIYCRSSRIKSRLRTEGRTDPTLPSAKAKERVDQDTDRTEQPVGQAQTQEEDATAVSMPTAAAVGSNLTVPAKIVGSRRNMTELTGCVFQKVICEGLISNRFCNSCS